jgi:DMSO/TMAO reductase YedYZ molybdopterin-dependent catalytic subunit
MADVLARVGVRAEATRVLVSGFDAYSQPSAGGSTPGASWIFTFAELEAAGAFLATVMNGAPLLPDHGAPVRLFVPGWFGCTCIKWVNQIVLVDDTAPATSQMQEFAARTHQVGVPALAAGYAPAKIQQAAMPVRIEKWSVSGALLYRIVGILWGGDAPTDRLQITFGDGEWHPVEVCPPHVQNATWTLWTYAWRPSQTGTFTISLRVDDPNVPQIRLDSGWYDRVVTVDEV